MKKITLKRKSFTNNNEENEFDCLLRLLGVEDNETFYYDNVDIIVDDEIEVY